MAVTVRREIASVCRSQMYAGGCGPTGRGVEHTHLDPIAGRWKELYPDDAVVAAGSPRFENAVERDRVIADRQRGGLTRRHLDDDLVGRRRTRSLSPTDQVGSQPASGSVDDLARAPVTQQS
jgi:hypothetical protein